MKYVLDASVALKWVLPEPDSAKAVQLRVDFQQSVHELVAPDTFQVEIAHALTRAERQGRLTPPDASILWADVMSTSPHLQSIDLLLPRAIELSSGVRIGVYDCLYLALAEREGCDLVTADAKLVANLASRLPFVVNLASLP